MGKPTEDYVEKFIRKIESGDDKGAYKLFQSHRDVVKKVGADKLTWLLTGLRNEGMADAASDLELGIAQLCEDTDVKSDACFMQDLLDLRANNPKIFEKYRKK